MADIIAFPGASGPKPSQAAANEVSGRVHAAAIREALKNASRMKDTDRLRAAENLWNILEKGEKRGIKKARVLHAGGQGGEGDSTKRLLRYAINPSLPDEEKHQRAKHLVQDGRKYLRIAEAAGTLAGHDENCFVATLFAGTSIGGAGAPDDEIHDADVYTELASLIREISRGIARKHDLAGMFRDIEEYRLCRNGDGSLWSGDDDWGALWSNFADGARVSGVDDLTDGYALPKPSHRTEGWLLPYPNLRIGWGGVIRRHKTPTGDHFTDLLPFTASHMAVNKKGEICDELIRDETGEPCVVLGEIIAEVRIALLPIGAGGSAEPVFITRLWTTIDLLDSVDICLAIDSDAPIPSILCWPWLPSEWQDSTYHELGTLELDLDLQPAFDVKQSEDICSRLIGKNPELIMNFIRGIECNHKGGLRIDVVSAESCRSVLDIVDSHYPCSREDEKLTRQIVITEADDINHRDGYICRSKENTLARAVEEGLFCVPAEHRIDALLDQVARHTANSVKAFCQPLRSLRRLAREEILQPWTDTNAI